MVSIVRKLRLRCKARLRKWRSDRFLKKHHVESWESYNVRYDKDRNQRADTVDTYYHGYPYVYPIMTPNHYAYKTLYDYGAAGFRTGADEMCEWCKEHCVGKFRADWHRAIQEYNGVWRFNGIAGVDFICFAFMDEHDLVWFKLRWG